VNADDKFEATLKLLEAGDYESARAHFHELAIKAEANETKSTYTLGELLALVKLGRTSEARRLLKVSDSFLRETDEGQVRAALIEGGLSTLLRTDAQTRRPTLEIPLPESINAERLARVITGFLGNLTRPHSSGMRPVWRNALAVSGTGV
jgi:hypothetical protein